MEAKELKNYWAPPNQRMQLYCKIHLWMSGIAVLIWSVFLISIFISEGKNGEYCIYTQDLNNYHIIVDGEPCLLQWYILLEFSYFFIVFLIPVQLPVWIVLWVLKKRNKKRHS